MFRMVMISLLVVAGACSGAVDPNVQLIAENIMSEEDISEADAMCIGEYTVENLSPENLRLSLFLGKRGNRTGGSRNSHDGIPDGYGGLRIMGLIFGSELISQDPLLISGTFCEVV